MYLIDTNIWLERLLDQERSKEVGYFFDREPSENFYITDFAFHSIGLILYRLNQGKTFLRFVNDAFIEGAINLIHLIPIDASKIDSAMRKYNLDFDDA